MTMTRKQAREAYDAAMKPAEEAFDAAMKREGT